MLYLEDVPVNVSINEAVVLAKRYSTEDSKGYINEILGNIEIGENSTIGAGSVVIKNVPDNCTVVGIPGRIVKHRICVQGELQHNKIPDPISNEINHIKHEIKEIKQKLSD